MSSNTSPVAESLLELTAELVAIPSVSHNEQEICAYVEAELRKLSWLETERIGDNLVARTNLGRPQRLILGGHLDTVPLSAPDGTPGLRREGDTLWGTGTADMKGALAVYLMLARQIPEPSVDVSYVFYACEEVARKYSGLLEIQAARPDLLECDAAILGEPTDGVVEAGCQGGLRASVKISGRRAHTARSWMGENAVHGLAPLLSALERYQPRKPVIDGCEFHESMQAVSVSGGVAGNVVPDEAELMLAHRFAPDRTATEAEQHVRDFVSQAYAAEDKEVADKAVADEVATGSATRNDGTSTTPEFTIEILDTSPACPPSLNHPLLQSLVQAVTDSDRPDPVRAKLGWTDVSFFAELGIPATNFGPGNPLLAHTAGEKIKASQLQQNHETLTSILLKS